MRNQSNIEDLVKLKPDYIGFIFYPKSKRFVGELITDEIQALIPVYIQKVGVFVDEPFDNLLEKFRSNKLDMIQLHGSELPGYCERLKKLDIPVIKVFSIDSDFDFDTVKPFNPFCDYYLFDTAGDLRGGTGIKFDWNLLSEYKGETPFLLSGGISPEDVESIKEINHPKFAGVDINSKFEISPGLKSLVMVSSFVHKLIS